MRPTARRRAYVFYATNDLYAVAVLVFVRLLRGLGIPGGTDVVVLHLPLSEYLLARMHSMQIVTRLVPAPRFVRDRYCRHCLVKLRVFGLTEYDQVVYVDADAIPLRPLEHLFEIALAERLAAPSAYWLPQPFWASYLLVVRPSAELWSRVQRHLASASERPLHDMDIVNIEFGREIHTLPARDRMPAMRNGRMSAGRARWATRRKALRGWRSSISRRSVSPGPIHSRTSVGSARAHIRCSTGCGRRGGRRGRRSFRAAGRARRHGTAAPEAGRRAGPPPPPSGTAVRGGPREAVP